MKFYMKQKFSFFDDFDIYDQNQNAVFHVDQKRWSWGHQAIIKDSQNGQDLVEIKQKLWKFLPTFEVLMDGQVVATIKKRMDLFKAKLQSRGIGLED